MQWSLDQFNRDPVHRLLITVEIFSADEWWQYFHPKRRDSWLWCIYMCTQHVYTPSHNPLLQQLRFAENNHRILLDFLGGRQLWDGIHCCKLHNPRRRWRIQLEGNGGRTEIKGFIPSAINQDVLNACTGFACLFNIPSIWEDDQLRECIELLQLWADCKLMQKYVQSQWWIAVYTAPVFLSLAPKALYSNDHTNCKALTASISKCRSCGTLHDSSGHDWQQPYSWLGFLSAVPILQQTANCRWLPL